MDVRRCWSSVQPLAAALLLLGTALVAATAIVHIENGTSALSRTDRAAFIWISVAALVLSWTAFWIIRCSSRARPTIVNRARPHRAVLYAALSTLAFAVGVLGVWTSSGSNVRDVQQPDSDSASRPHRNQLFWTQATTTATAVAWLLAASALLVLSIVAAVRDIQPGQETPPALRLLRCSCCSPPVQRVVLALPFFSLTIACAVFWHHAAAFHHICAAASEPPKLLMGSSLIFGSIVVALGVASALPLVTRRSATQGTHAQRRLRRAVVFCCLVAFAVASITWAVKSWRWLAAYDRKTLTKDASSCLLTATQTVRAVRFTTGALLTAGGLLLAMTSCCRLERHLLPTAATPQVDLSMLSPHAIRPPALTKSPHQAI